tara:strand:+ start:858 stop:1142 length:285 start_codon:yes stop_codon:yes gene_type:complete
MITNEPHDESVQLLLDISKIYGEHAGVTRVASRLKGNRLFLAVDEFYDKTDIDSIQGLSDEDVDLLFDILFCYLENQFVREWIDPDDYLGAHYY